VIAPREKLAQARLYGIVDLGYVDPGRLVSVASELLEGGVEVLQLRAKEWGEPDVGTMARALLPVCRERGVPFVVNDFPEVAAAVGADGVHLGQDDGSLRDARAIVGEEMLVGRSTHSPAQARAALAEGFDYIGFGPLFPTPTKQGRPGIGLADVAAVTGSVGRELPVFCIGGIKPGNLDQVLAAGAKRVVIVSALLQAEDVTGMTREVAQRLP
jgi:thiamine-phosphate pyrophosphorylase